MNQPTAVTTCKATSTQQIAPPTTTKRQKTTPPTTAATTTTTNIKPSTLQKLDTTTIATKTNPSTRQKPIVICLSDKEDEPISNRLRTPRFEAGLKVMPC